MGITQTSRIQQRNALLLHSPTSPSPRSRSRIQDPPFWTGRPDRGDLRSKKYTIHFLWTASYDSAAQVKTLEY